MTLIIVLYYICILSEAEDDEERYRQLSWPDWTIRHWEALKCAALFLFFLLFFHIPPVLLPSVDLSLPLQHCGVTGGCKQWTYLMAQECWLAASVPSEHFISSGKTSQLSHPFFSFPPSATHTHFRLSTVEPPHPQPHTQRHTQTSHSLEFISLPAPLLHGERCWRSWREPADTWPLRKLLLHPVAPGSTRAWSRPGPHWKTQLQQSHRHARRVSEWVSKVPGFRLPVMLKEHRPFFFFFPEKNSLRPPAPASFPNTPAQNGSGSCLWQDVNQGRAKWMSSLLWCTQDTPKLSPLLSLQSPGFRNDTTRRLKASNLFKLAQVLYATGASSYRSRSISTEEWIKH